MSRLLDAIEALDRAAFRFGVFVGFLIGAGLGGLIVLALLRP